MLSAGYTPRADVQEHFPHLALRVKAKANMDAANERTIARFRELAGLRQLDIGSSVGIMVPKTTKKLLKVSFTNVAGIVVEKDVERHLYRVRYVNEPLESCVLC